MRRESRGADSREQKRPGLLSAALLSAALLSHSLAAQEARIASDFEIATAQRQLERERDPLLKMAAHLNLGDLYLTRRDVSLAQGHYRSAEALAQKERLGARRRSDLSSYATATGYLGLANAKLGRAAETYDAFEEAIRYASDSARLWNLYATGMSLVERPAKAVGAARRAVAIASSNAGDAPSASTLLDIAVYRYALASALLAVNESEEAEHLLLQIIDALESNTFERIRDQIARQEKFEVFSTTRTDADSYLSLRNRAGLRLARLYEERGDRARAIAQVQKVLELRTDDPIALTTLARLTTDEQQRERYFADAFDANPFSIELIREYERDIAGGVSAPPQGTTPGRLVQRASFAYASGKARQSSEIVAELASRYPQNDVVEFLRARNQLVLGDAEAARAAADRLRRSPELRGDLLVLIEQSEVASRPPAFLARPAKGAIEPVEQDLKQLAVAIRLNRLTPEQRARLDQLVFSGMVRFDAPTSSSQSTTTFSSGSIGEVRFRFQQPTEFRGRFSTSQMLRLDYRILGVTETDGQAVFLFEPLRIATL